MKKITLFVAALVCACILTAGTASAESPTGYSAGLSPNLVNPLPNNKKATPPPKLDAGANRLIRWQGWQDVDAFSASVLEQMQRQVNAGELAVGTFTMDEPSIAAAVSKAQVGGSSVAVGTCTSRCGVKTAVSKAQAAIPGFEVNPKLKEDGESFAGDVTLWVWTYRHNYTDTGLYQLYVSVTGKILIGKGWIAKSWSEEILHNDIQSFRYEFGPGFVKGGENLIEQDIYAEVEIWRGAVAEVNARGELTVVGNEGGVETPESVEAAPIAAWEVAPSLIGNPTYNPKAATGPKYAHPADHIYTVRKLAGDVQATTPQRVRTLAIPRRGASRQQ